MKAIIFICSNILISWAIIRLWKYQGKKTFGISLSKQDVVILLLLESILLVLCFIDFHQVLDYSNANDFAWNSMIIYYRGVLPVAGLMAIWDFELNNTISAGLLMFLGVIVFDLVLLRLITYFKFVMQN